MGTFTKEAAQMKTMKSQFRNTAFQAFGRIIPVLELADLRVAILCLLPIIQS